MIGPHLVAAQLQAVDHRLVGLARPGREADLEPEIDHDVPVALTESGSAELGLGRRQYTENVGEGFWAKQRAHTTLLVSGLSLAALTVLLSAGALWRRRVGDDGGAMVLYGGVATPSEATQPPAAVTNLIAKYT